MPWSKDDNPYKQWQKAYFSFLLTWVRRGLARDWAGQCHLGRWTRTWWESHCLQKRNWRGERLQDMDNWTSIRLTRICPVRSRRIIQNENRGKISTDGGQVLGVGAEVQRAVLSVVPGKGDEQLLKNWILSSFTSCSACPGCRPACLQRRCHIFPCWQWTRQAQTTGIPER